MNTFKRRCSFFFSVFLAVILPLFIVGCSGGGCASKPSTVVLKASKTTHVGVATGIRTWDAYIAQQVAEIKVSEMSTNAADIKATAARKAKLVEQAKQVRDAYAKYRTAQKSALTIAAEANRLEGEDPASAAAQDRAAVAWELASVALNEVGTLLTAFGVEVK